MKRTAAFMTEGPILKNAILYSIPVILTGILQLLFNAADLVIVGRFRGSLAVAAVGATGSVTNLIVNLFIGLSIGAGVIVAQGIGARDFEAVHRAVHTAVPAALIGGLVLSGVGIVGARTFLTWMGTQPDVIDAAALYMRIYFGGMAANMLYNFGASMLRAAGDIKSPLFYLTLSGVVNVLLNLLFVVGLHRGVDGVAIATVLSQTLSAVLILYALSRREDATRLIFRELHIHPKSLLQMVRIGLPAGVQGSLFSISNVIIQSSVNSFGSVAMSGNAAAGNIEGFVYVSMNAVQQTAVNFVGQNYGAKKFDRVGKAAGICLVLVTVVGVVMGVGGYLCARPLLSVYITDSFEAIEVGVTRMSMVCLTYALCGVMDVMTGALRGMGASTLPMIVSVLGVCVFRIVWIFTVFHSEAFHTLKVLYASYPISWILTFAVEALAFVLLLKKEKRKAAVAA